MSILERELVFRTLFFLNAIGNIVNGKNYHYSGDHIDINWG